MMLVGEGVQYIFFALFIGALYTRILIPSTVAAPIIEPLRSIDSSQHNRGM
jgi:hypothetical protein